MKRQLDRLKGKRLVTGDPNLMTKDEICINATPNGVEVKEIGTDGSIKDIASGGGGGDSEEVEYYRLGSIDGPGIITELKEKYPDLTLTNINAEINNYMIINLFSSYEVMFADRTGQYTFDNFIGNPVLLTPNNICNIIFAYFKITKKGVYTDIEEINNSILQMEYALSTLKYANELKSITYKINKEEYDKVFNTIKDIITNN